MNEMRERLTQLIHDAHMAIISRDDNSDTYTAIADYLLDNGVIVPPCKVGQTVWYIDRYTGNIETDTVKYLTVTKSGIHAQLVYHNQKFWDIYRQGKDVFFTREAAEEALKARENEKNH